MTGKFVSQFLPNAVFQFTFFYIPEYLVYNWKLQIGSVWLCHIFDPSPVGLNVETCHIIEMACLITDENLNIVAEVGIDSYAITVFPVKP